MSGTPHVDSFDAASLDKHCAAQPLSWSQMACSMAAEGLLLEFEEQTPPRARLLRLSVVDGTIMQDTAVCVCLYMANGRICS